MRQIACIFLLVIFLSTSGGVVFAATKKPAKTAAKKISSDVMVTASVNAAKTAVTVYFSNLNNASSVSYSLSYTTNGKTEGAGGQIDTKGKYSLSRTLLFGTCSAGVCRYHGGIRNAKVTVYITYKNGRTQTKVIPLAISGGSAKTLKNAPVKKAVKKQIKKVVPTTKKSSKR